MICLFAWFDSLRPINNILVIKRRVFLGWTSTKLGLMLLLKDTTQWRWWGSNPRPLGLESSTLPLSHCAPDIQSWIQMEETQVQNADEYDQEMPQSQTTHQSTKLQERDTEH